MDGPYRRRNSNYHVIRTSHPLMQLLWSLPLIRSRSVSSYIIMSKIDPHISIVLRDLSMNMVRKPTHHYDYPPQHLLRLPITLSRWALFTVNNFQDRSSIITTKADTPWQRQRRSIQYHNKDEHFAITTKTPSPHCHHIYYLHMSVL